MREQKCQLWLSENKKENTQKHASPHGFDLSYNMGSHWFPNWSKFMFHLPQTLFLVELEIDGNFLLVRKSMENFFGSSAQHYMLVREYNNTSIIKPMMIVKLNKTMIFFFLIVNE